MDRPDSKDIFGAEIQYFRLEPRYWEPTVKLLKDTGWRCVTSYVPWEAHCVGAPDGRNPAGVLDFEGRTDERLNLPRFLDILEKHEMDLNFRSGPFVCAEMTCGGHPRWLVTGEPDMMVWDYQNRPAQGYWIAGTEGSQPSYLHPKYLELVGHWFDAVCPYIVAHAKGDGGCVSMVNLDNEVSYIVRDSFLGSDYNPVNVAPGGFYHQFLAERYGSVDALPYPGSHDSFEQVRPPRAVPERIGDDLRWYLDWIDFKTWCMCRYLATLRRMHADRGVRGVRWMTNLNPHLPEGVPTRMSAFEDAVRGLVGYDFYRGTFLSYSGYHSMARVLKLMNASVSYTWSAEFMSGTWQKELNTRVSDDHMRFMARAALAHGCKALSWFMFHDRDSWGDSPVSNHAHKRPSWDVLRDTHRLCFQRIADWDALEPVTDVAVIYDLVQHQHTAIGDPLPCNDNANHVGKPVIDGAQAGAASMEYYGLFRVIEQAGPQPGVADILRDAGRLDAYRLAFLPGAAVAERAASAALRQWVEAGGTLVVIGPWPGRDENGAPLRFLDVDPDAFADGPEAARDAGRGHVVWHRRPIARDEPGREDAESVAWVRTLVDQAGITPAVRIEPSETPVRWRAGKRHVAEPRCLGSAVLQRNDRETLVFVSNLYPEAVRFTLTLADPPGGKLVDLDDGTELELADGQVEVDVDRKTCAVFKIT
ncbi:MAG: beta-galactosidase [Planctomycetota bacterium]